MQKHVKKYSTRKVSEIGQTGTTMQVTDICSDWKVLMTEENIRNKGKTKSLNTDATVTIPV